MAWALEKVFWPGRCHTISLPSSDDWDDVDGNGIEVSMNLRCDGAHTPLSIDACIDWFRNVAGTPATSPGRDDRRNVRRVLVFNCGHERNPLPLLFGLYNSKLFESVYFCRADFERPSAVPKRLDEDWARESLVDENYNDGEAVALEGICAGMRTSGLRMNCDGEDDAALTPDKLLGSTWQETLANLWRVFDLHQNGRCTTEVAAGMNVKGALYLEHALQIRRGV